MHYTFFDKPQFFNALQDEEVTGNEFFDLDKIKLPELESEKEKLKGEFYIKQYFLFLLKYNWNSFIIFSNFYCFWSFTVVNY